MFSRIRIHGVSLAALGLGAIGLFLYACAQVDKAAKPEAVPPAKSKPVVSSLPTGIGEVEDPTQIPVPGPPFAKQNRDPNVVLRNMPKDAEGNDDWVAALKDGLLKPQGSLEPNKPDMPPFPLDVEIPAVGAMPNVIFPHGPHTMWLECGNCHPGIFTMRKGSNPISMVKIVNGEFCGRCHGRVAFPISNCTRCHVKPKT